MITPRFSVRQDAAHVYVTIHAPHVRAQTIEFDVDGDQLKFFASPYYLRLTFPGQVVEDDGSTASFDAASGDISVVLAKQTPGEDFANLDLLTSLLATRQERAAGRPAIEELGIDEALQQARLDDDFDWELPQLLAPADGEAPLLAAGAAKYGFDQQYSGYLAHVHSTANEINEVADPENMSAEERRQGRLACEDAKFDEGYYMAGYMDEDDEIQPLIEFKPPALADGPQDDAPFSDADRRLMLDLPRKTHLVADKRGVYLGLVDLLFSYALEVRISRGEFTVESAWAIGATSATLSNLEQHASLRAAAVACFRRGLAYPLHRSWELCERALDDVRALCSLGRRAILRAFLEMKRLFDGHDIYYVYSKLYLDDYCAWLQTAASDTAIRSLAHKIGRLRVSKEETGWPLDELEELALQTTASGAEDLQPPAESGPEGGPVPQPPAESGPGAASSPAEAILAQIRAGDGGRDRPLVELLD